MRIADRAFMLETSINHLLRSSGWRISVSSRASTYGCPDCRIQGVPDDDRDFPCPLTQIKASHADRRRMRTARVWLAARRAMTRPTTRRAAPSHLWHNGRARRRGS